MLNFTHGVQILSKELKAQNRSLIKMRNINKRKIIEVLNVKNYKYKTSIIEKN